MSLVADTLIADDAAASAGPAYLPVVMERVSAEAWDGIAAGFDDVCQEQLAAFARHRWPSVGLDPVIFRRDGEIVGGVLIMLQSLPLGVARVAIAKWGPMLADADRPDAHLLYAGMVEALIEHYARARRMMLSIWPHADLAGQNRRFDQLIARGFRAGSRLLFPNRYIVNLRLSDEEQRASFEQKWRYHLKRSEKAGLSFEHGDASRMPEFDALYLAMTDRKRFADHSAYDTVPALLAASDERLRPELFFVRHEGEIVAGAIIFKAGDHAVYLFGATNERALPLRAGYFLHWHIIRWLRDHTPANWYDLGGTDGFHGLHQFKKGMVGARGVMTPVPPVANFAVYRFPRAAGTAAFAIRDVIQRLRRRLEWSKSDVAKPDQAKHTDTFAGER